MNNLLSFNIVRLGFDSLPPTLQQAINSITATMCEQGNTFTVKLFIGVFHIGESASTKLVVYSRKPQVTQWQIWRVRWVWSTSQSHYSLIQSYFGCYFGTSVTFFVSLLIKALYLIFGKLLKVILYLNQIQFLWKLTSDIIITYCCQNCGTHCYKQCTRRDCETQRHYTMATHINRLHQLPVRSLTWFILLLLTLPNMTVRLWL